MREFIVSIKDRVRKQKPTNKEGKMKRKNVGVTRISATVHIRGTYGGRGDIPSIFKGLSPNIRHITSEYVCPKTREGHVVAYVTDDYFSPSTLFGAVTGYTREEGFNCRDYANLFLASEAMFSFGQVSDILHNHRRYSDVLNLTGKTNIFPVWVNGDGHTILAQFLSNKWYIKDSIFGMGRGTNPGVHLLLRNEYVKVEV